MHGFRHDIIKINLQLVSYLWYNTVHMFKSIPLKPFWICLKHASHCSGWRSPLTNNQMFITTNEKKTLNLREMLEEIKMGLCIKLFSDLWKHNIYMHKNKSHMFLRSLFWNSIIHTPNYGLGVTSPLNDMLKTADIGEKKTLKHKIYLCEDLEKLA